MPRNAANAPKKPRIRRKTVHRALEPRDLLGRPIVNLDTPELQRFVAGKTILVTGAGGSIGSEICRQTLRFCPKHLVLLERAENALFEIDRELHERWVGAQITPIIADITDQVRIEGVFEQFKPDVVFHAAAHKHVPMMEHNPGEAIKNNIFGTQTVASVAAHNAVGTFVLISTDKAVNPTSVMGASKRVAEMVAQGMNSCELRVASCESKTRSSLATRNSKLATSFVAVRFGNVLASSGSVVPIFRKQIERGGPVTVTHPDMRRYFMTIPEASQLVMQAAAIGRGGEVFVLDMGEPIRILDLAQRMIRDAGLKIGRDIEIQFSGIRAGEKLYEELAGQDDVTLPTSHPRIRVWELPRVEALEVELMLQNLREVIDSPREMVINSLMTAVQEYRPSEATLPMRLVKAA
jgi:FlaA1/EpsC-like NDP-sugar epimerase